MEIKGKYFDGKSSHAHDVWIEIHDQNLMIIRQDRTKKKSWSLSDTHVLDQPQPPQPARLIHKKNPDERLYIDGGENWNTLKNQLPQECYQRISLAANGPSAVGYIVATIAFVAFLFIIAPTLLEKSAALIPDSMQKEIGRHAIHSMAGDKICTNEKGIAALNILMDRLEQATNHEINYEITVINNDKTMNAVTGPGAVFALFSGIIINAETPEEVAGVMAHELSHSELSHPIRGFVRDAGVSILFQMIFGKDLNIMNAARIAGTLKFSRDQEQEADSYGQNILLNANIDPQYMTTFFERLAAKEEKENNKFKEILPYISTHPDTRSRINILKANTQKPSNPDPILSAQQWEDLRNICK